MALRVWYSAGTNIEYGAITEYGGDIVPVNSQFLRFVVNGQEVFTKRVTIPAQPYLRPAFDTKRNDATQEVGRVFEMLVIRKHITR